MSRRLLAVLVAAMFALSLVAATSAFQTQAPAKKAKKIWMNEDVEALRPGGVTVLKPAPVASTAPSTAAEEAAAKKEEGKAEGEKKEGVTPLEKIQKRLEPLRSELAVIEMQLQTLRANVASGNTTGGAIKVDKAPGGLNTQNQLTQLENRKAILLRQISDIQDEARRLGISPGAVR